MDLNEAMGKSTLLVRADGGGEIGLGHVMRCASIAQEAVAMGYGVLFAVSDEVSAEAVHSAGLDAQVVGGDRRRFEGSDAAVLSRLVSEVDARCVLVDSYAATPSFLASVKTSLSVKGVRTAYIDDLFRNDCGYLSLPQIYAVDIVINYSFGCSVEQYRMSYGEGEVKFLVGPTFAPVRNRFRNRDYWVRDEVDRVLVTSGSTNPNGYLELMASACRMALPDAAVDVIVGPHADFDDSGVYGLPGMGRLVFHRDPDDIADLMLSSDLAVSAAGSTLYELACVGVPTIPVALVENQLTNTRGWAALGLGAVDELHGAEWWHLVSTVKELGENPLAREKASSRLRKIVDGKGVQRIAKSLMHDATV